MDHSWTRREFLSRAAGSAASLTFAPTGKSALAYGAGKPWVAYSWLWEVAEHAVFARGGRPAILVLTSLVYFAVGASRYPFGRFLVVDGLAGRWTGQGKTRRRGDDETANAWAKHHP